MKSKSLFRSLSMLDTFKIETHIPYLEELFHPWKAVIGSDFQGYRNHVYRMVQFCWALKKAKGETLTDEEKQKIMIAGVYHDIGIWPQKTLDYIAPSVSPALIFLEEQGLSKWKQEITLMIENHHKFREYKGEYPELVELFRQGDVIDFTLGVGKFHLPKSFIVKMKKTIPNAGFHMGLLKKGCKWSLFNPLNPVPMMKW